MYPKPLRDLIEAFTKYPGIGIKTAERLAIHSITKLDTEHNVTFASALIECNDKLSKCKICNNLTENSICDICADNNRDKSLLMVVEDIKDLYILEKTKQFNGYYHVLNGVLSPIDGIGIEEINLVNLFERLKNENIKEIIIALNATVEGETTILYIKKILENTDILVTTLAYGLAVGGDLQYTDEITLKRALEGRIKI